MLLCLHLLGTSVVVAAGSEQRDLLVGRWTCEIEYGRWTVERRADGSFEKKGQIVRTLDKPPESFNVKGRWRLKGKKYLEIWDEVWPATWSQTKRSVTRAEVLLLTRGKFKRIQNDSPVFIETRIE
jgi:hypothetical protein